MNNPFSSDYSEKENVALVDKVLKGNSKALDRLVDIHQEFIYNFDWKMTHSNEDALDLTQKVLIKVITKLSTFKRENEFRNWLYWRSVNEFYKIMRKVKDEIF